MLQTDPPQNSAEAVKIKYYQPFETHSSHRPGLTAIEKDNRNQRLL